MLCMPYAYKILYPDEAYVIIKRDIKYIFSFGLVTLNNFAVLLTIGLKISQQLAARIIYDG